MKFLSLLLLFPCLFAEAALTLTEGKGGNFIYDQDPKALSSSIVIALPWGSIHDPAGKSGLASISFDALVRGSKEKSKQEFYSTMERLGASISVDVGTTRTLITLQSISENLTKTIPLLAEVLLHPRMQKDDILDLKEESLAGLNRELSNNRALLRRVLRSALYSSTPLALPPQGNLETVKNISVDDIRAFVNDKIGAKGMIVAVSSNLPKDQISQLLKASFDKIPEGKQANPLDNQIPPPSGKKLYLVARKGSNTSEMAISHFGYGANDKEKELLELANFNLGGDMSSRMFQILRGKNGWTYGAYSGFQLLETPRKHGSAFVLYSFPHAEHTDKTLKEMNSIYKDYVEKGLTQKELTFSKQSLMNSYPFKFAQSRGRVQAKLYEALEGSPLLTVESYRKLLGATSQKDLLKAIQKFHQTKNFVTVVVGDPQQFEALKKSPFSWDQVILVDDPMSPVLQ